MPIRPLIVSFTLFLVLGFAGNVQVVQAQGGCRVCELCDDGNGHPNVGGLTPFAGNVDDTHGCYAKTCEYMQMNGVHENDAVCDLGFAARDELLTPEVIDARLVRALLAKYPDHLALDPTGRYLQALDCAGDEVVAQVAVRQGMIRRATLAVGQFLTKAVPLFVSFVGTNV